MQRPTRARSILIERKTLHSPFRLQPHRRPARFGSDVTNRDDRREHSSSHQDCLDVPCCSRPNCVRDEANFRRLARSCSGHSKNRCSEWTHIVVNRSFFAQTAASRGPFDLGRSLVLLTSLSMSGLNDRTGESSSEHSMNGYFRRQLADYVEYPRDPWNCAMHVFGIVFLFLAAVLPLSTWTIHLFGGQATAATISVVPVLIWWLLLDAALGTAILGAAALLLATAAMIVSHSSAAAMWSITGVLIVIGLGLQAVGHQVFERRPPG